MSERVPAAKRGPCWRCSMSTSTWAYRDGALVWQHPNDCSQEPLVLLTHNGAPMTWDEGRARARFWYAVRDVRHSAGFRRVYWWPVERYPAA